MYVYGVNYKIEMNFSDLFFVRLAEGKIQFSLSLSLSLSEMQAKLLRILKYNCLIFLYPDKLYCLKRNVYYQAPAKLSGKLLYNIITCMKIKKKYFGMIQYFLYFYFHSLCRIKKIEQVFLLTLFLFFNQSNPNFFHFI